MRRAVMGDGNIAVYEDGTVKLILDGKEVPAPVKLCRNYYGFSFKKQYMVHRLFAIQAAKVYGCTIDELFGKEETA